MPKTRKAVNSLLKLRVSDYSNGWNGQIITDSLSEILVELESLRPIFEATPRTHRLKAALEMRDPYSKGIAPEHRKARDRAFKSLGEYFQNVAHHNTLAEQSDFNSKIASFEDILISYLTPVSVAQQNEILKIIECPSTTTAEERLNFLLLHNGANLIFFLERLADISWLPFMERLGLFSRLQEAEITEEGTIYRADRTLSCLARLSHKAPAKVLGILKRLPQSSNPQVPDQIMRCIAGIEDQSLIPDCLKLLKKLLKQPGRHGWIWIEEILKKWTGWRNTNETIDLIGEYIHSQISQQQNRYESGGGWQFNEIDRHFLEPLATLHPLALAKVLFRALCFWRLHHIELRAAEPGKLEEFSVANTVDIAANEPPTYRIEDFHRRSSRNYELEEILAIRMFSIGSLIFANGNETTIREFDDLLRSNNWELFSRLRWQIYGYSDFSV
ncbi:hypothetical protein WJU23_18230 [Prosthecobacter sp. SYSU 5D2]|uniref:hypothetical protein n=1 Tax=Prosthecobacter sp. SYSU 5D2 TaxID=3134134 RepID=UPI0031FE8536